MHKNLKVKAQSTNQYCKDEKVNKYLNHKAANNI
jgi:hypothetical protein